MVQNRRDNGAKREGCGPLAIGMRGYRVYDISQRLSVGAVRKNTRAH